MYPFLFSIVQLSFCADYTVEFTFTFIFLCICDQHELLENYLDINNVDVYIEFFEYEDCSHKKLRNLSVTKLYAMIIHSSSVFSFGQPAQ